MLYKIYEDENDKEYELKINEIIDLIQKNKNILSYNHNTFL